jgi:hypothetical protein
VPATGFELLGRSAELRTYLLQHITVSQSGMPCTGAIGELDDVDDLLRDGMPLTFTCADDVDLVDISITALTDLHEAYRTVAIADAAPGRVLYTWDDGTHEWDFSAGSTASLFGGGTVAVAAGLVLLSVVLLTLTMRRGRSVR